MEWKAAIDPIAEGFHLDVWLGSLADAGAIFPGIVGLFDSLRVCHS